MWCRSLLFGWFLRVPSLYMRLFSFGKLFCDFYLELEIPSRGLRGGSSCDACTNTSVSSLLFLLLAQITAAITVIATSTHTMSNIPPTPADIAAAVFVLWTVELGVGVGDAIQYKRYCCLLYYHCSVPYLQQALTEGNSSICTTVG